ncbi:MAG: superoxide dismutase [Bacteroidetes bacterium]|nr:MAG: superoxide dismutase [Bacteroidota bacterium]
MEKRTFLKTGLLLTVGAAMAPLIKACKSGNKAAATNAGMTIPPPKLRRTTPFTLPALPYDTGALEPHIDKMTMEIHHGKHHQGYVNKLNAAVKDTVYAEYELDDIIARVTTADAEKNVRNNAGGHWNHSLFWQVMAPDGGGKPGGQLASGINAAFGSFEQFQTAFSDASKSVFGSGWAWLCVGKDKSLFITTTPNQDNPMMLQIASNPGTPILGLDVWEHAYYLKHQNKRADYISTFFNVINWNEVGRLFDKAMFG